MLLMCLINCLAGTHSLAPSLPPSPSLTPSLTIHPLTHSSSHSFSHSLTHSHSLNSQVCFFVSYLYMDSIISKWHDMGILQELMAHKLVFIETQVGGRAAQRCSCVRTAIAAL